MKNNLWILFLILLISYKECSDCTEYKGKSESGGTDTSSDSGTSTSSSGTTGSGSGTGTKASGSTGSGSGADASSSGSASSSSANSEGRRRLANAITNDECKKLSTQDDDKYQCVIKSDKSGCEEVSKEEAKIYKISFIILMLLFLL